MLQSNWRYCSLELAPNGASHNQRSLDLMNHHPLPPSFHKIKALVPQITEGHRISIKNESISFLLPCPLHCSHTDVPQGSVPGVRFHPSYEPLTISRMLGHATPRPAAKDFITLGKSRYPSFTLALVPRR